jgi:hypothetical protein
MTPTTIHLACMAVVAVALLTAVIGAALHLWRISPSASPWAQMLIRFGMGISGAFSFASVLSALVSGAGWRERVHWELATDAGFAILAVGLVTAAIERDLVRRAKR